MIEVHSEPTVSHRHGKWELVLWMGKPFDYAIPFRPTLNEITERLGHEVHFSLMLPEYEPCEDFVEGSLQIGGEILHIYFEHSLGYLSLSSENREVLDKPLISLQPAIAVAKGNDDRKPGEN